MADKLDLVGVDNINEFFSNFYLASQFGDDLAAADKESAKEGAAKAENAVKDAPKLLGGLRDLYFRAFPDMERAKSAEERIERARPFLEELLVKLGYTVFKGAELRETVSGSIPILAEAAASDNAPLAWVVHVEPGPDAESRNPIANALVEAQYGGLELNSKRRLTYAPLEALIPKEIFGLKYPPRWIIAVSFERITLVDRSKWIDKRLLSFDLREIFDRRERATLQAFWAFLAKPALCPAAGEPILDRFDASSNKHAVSVSDDLKYAARQVVELFGNEAVRSLSKQRKRIYNQDLANKLTRESLVYLYRLLFIFVMEARADRVGYLPMKSEAYRKGYSLESLRDLEMTPMTPESEEGYFFDESVKFLFEHIWSGTETGAEPSPAGRPDAGLLAWDAYVEAGEEKSAKILLANSFRIEPLQCKLFDPERTPTLNGVKFRNSVWQKAIRLLSLTRESNGGGKGKGRKARRRGRISYARLGVSQLGAVYEGLLSYRGFFAETDLYEVKKVEKNEKKEQNVLEQGFFVPAERLDQFADDERVLDENGRPRVFPKGSFIYRLAGRDRDTSASFYTPDSLTKCLVKYALKELIGDKPSDSNYKTADEILDLTLCEPAMGSAAFLNEAINQLADAYLRRKQAELDQWIPAERIEVETQKVRTYLADRNVFGADLNPVAVELGEISLWLNSIFAEENPATGAPRLFAPWFERQLVCGNSLVGVRRQVYDSADLTGKSAQWFDVEPKPVEHGSKRPAHTVYAFLVPQPGMLPYDDKYVRKLMKNMTVEKDGKLVETDCAKLIDAWKKEFIRPFDKSDVKLLEDLSDKLDELWELCEDEMRAFRNATTDRLDVFGRGDADREDVPFREKEKLADEFATKRIFGSTPYRRIKAVADYWCALWFWPIEKAPFLPSREEYLAEISLALTGGLVGAFASKSESDATPLFPDDMRAETLGVYNAVGPVDIDALGDKIPRFAIVNGVAKEQRFLHWELEFADIFKDRGGFDLTVGNPPWIKLGWDEKGLISDHRPEFAIKKLSASQTTDMRDDVLMDAAIRSDYLKEYVSLSGQKSFLNATCNYALLKGSPANLFKCFIPNAWRCSSIDGVVGFVHPDGIYNDPNGGRLRSEVYSRLRYHFQFTNELKLFTDVHHHTKYSVNVYGERREKPGFKHIANLFLPQTVDSSIEREAPESTPVQGIKNDLNEWNVTGHQDRVIDVTDETLKVFSKVFDKLNTPLLEARLPSIHAVQLLDVLRKFTQYPNHLGDKQSEIKTSRMWNETEAQQDHTIRRETRFPKTPQETILSGPHFFVGTPHYKSPRAICKLNSDYDIIDNEILPEDYLPRTNYVPDCSFEEYRLRLQEVPWNKTKKVADYYRCCFRSMLSQTGERTLICSIIPPGFGHINTCIAPCFKDNDNLISCVGAFISLPYDYCVKLTGKSNLFFSDTDNFPLFSRNNKIFVRTLILSCLTKYYSALWQEVWNEDYNKLKL